MGGVSLLGKLLLGMVSDRIEPIRLIVASTVILVVGILAGAAAQNEAMLFAFYVCVGFGFGGVNAVFPTPWPTTSGPRRSPRTWARAS